jgi:hypothetical protein
MKMNKLLVLGALALVGCGVEGTYTLDKAESKKNAEAEIAKMPADQQTMAKSMLGMFDDMNVSIELKSGGTYSSKMTMKGLNDGKEKEDTGTWKKDGDTITISTKTPGGNDKEIKCTKSGKSLSCTEGSEKNKMTMVFTKA